MNNPNENRLNADDISFEVLDDIDLASQIFNESNDAFVPSTKSPNMDLEDLLEKFKDDLLFKIFVVKVGDEIAAYLIQLSGKRDNEVAIGPMFVSKQYRGRGLATKLVEEITSTTRNAGNDSIFTKTWESNAASRNIFSKIGFKHINTVDSDRANGNSSLEYRLQL